MTKYNMILAVLVSALLSGCLLTRTQVEEAEKDRKMSEQVQNMQRDRADQADQMNDLNEQLRQLSGRLEILENDLRVSNAAKKELEEKSTSQLAEKDQKLTILQDAIGKQEEQIKALQAEISARGSDKDGKAEEKNDKKQNSYQVGEAHFKKQEWKEAILNYQKYNDKFPKGKNVADATYKMGVCFQELGMQEEAKTFYEEVIAKFPGTETAKSAKYRLKKLK